MSGLNSRRWRDGARIDAKAPARAATEVVRGRVIGALGLSIGLALFALILYASLR